MPSFTIDAPNGKSYTIEGENADGALTALRKHLGEDVQVKSANSAEEPADHGLSERQKLSPAERALSPITGYPETYQRMNKEARDMVSSGVSQMMHPDSLTDPGAHGISDVLTGAGKAALGGIGYVASPVTAAYRSVVGQPVEDVTGIPREYTEFAAQLATPGIGFARAGAVKPGVATEVLPAATEGQQVAQAAERVGVDLPRAVTSDNMALQQTGKVAANVPIAGLPLRRAAQTSINQMDEAMGATRAEFGTGDVAAAGAGVREGVTDALKNGPIKQRVNKLYEKVDELVDPTTTGPMTNTRNLANVIEARRVNGALPQSAKVAELEGALSRPGMNYEGIKDLRSYFGEMLDGSKVIPEGLGQREVKQIYGALSDDMRNIIARAGGQDGLKAYNQAERAAARWSTVREDLQRVLNIKSEEGIFSKIVDAASSRRSADIQLLGRVRGAVGADKWDEVASALIEKLGRAPDGAFSPDRLLGPNGLGGLSAEGKRMLFRSTGKSSHADAIDDIATISTRWKSLNQFANPSGTAQSAGWSAGTIAGFLDPVSTVASFTGSAILAKFLSMPASSRQMANWSRSYEKAATNPTPATVEAFKQASKVFATTAGRDLGKPDMTVNFMKQLQGAVPAGAQGEQR